MVNVVHAQVAVLKYLTNNTHWQKAYNASITGLQYPHDLCTPVKTLLDIRIKEETHIFQSSPPSSWVKCFSPGTVCNVDLINTQHHNIE